MGDLNAVPTQLKLRIFEARLDANRPINANTHFVYAQGALLPLALVCKAFRDIAMDIYYKKNVFSLQTTGAYRRDGHLIQYPNPAIGHFVRKLTMNLNIDFNFESLDAVLQSEMDWRHFPRIDESRSSPPLNYRQLRLNYGSRELIPEWSRESATRWQNHFPKLDQLRIVLSLPKFESVGQHCFGQPSVADLALLFEDAKVVVRAKNVVIVVTGGICSDDGSVRITPLISPCGGQCKTNITTAICLLMADNDTATAAASRL